MNQVILWIMAAGVVLGGGIDRIFEARKGYGKKFEEGFFFLEPTALSMAGMIWQRLYWRRRLAGSSYRPSACWALTRLCLAACWQLIWAAISWPAVWPKIH